MENDQLSNQLISCICLTYGRPERLVEAIECYRRQKCNWPSELVVYNTCPQQKLVLESPVQGVRIINANERPKSLGAARNLAIAAARGSVLVTWDDDDLYLEHYLETFVKAWTAHPEAQWVWQNHQFYSEGGKIQKMTSGTCNTFAFTREAWERAGKYGEDMNVGEDRALITRITTAIAGHHCTLSPHEAGFIYCWGNGVYHMSGQGNDKPGRTNSWRRSELLMEARFNNGTAVQGRVVIRPQWRADYQTMAESYLRRNNLEPYNPEATGVVMLGRYGDIINALPIVKRLHDDGFDPHVIVASEFAGILDGVSYAKPVPLNVQFDQLEHAMKFARERFKNVVCCQIYGKLHHQERLTPSYNHESWRVAGFEEHFHDKYWPVVFDRRNVAKEEALKRKLFHTDKPKIVTNLTSAKTAPFASGRRVLQVLQAYFGMTHEVVDIGKLRLDRIYELVGVIESASLFISIDTATLHLAAATQTPVVALINDLPWAGSEVRYNCAAKLRYSEATAEAVVEATAKALHVKFERSPQRNAIVRLPAARLKLPAITLWACCWSLDQRNFDRTLRVLHYCHRFFDFGRIVFFTHMPVRKPVNFPLDVIRIPRLSMETWNTFNLREVPKHITSDFALSVHEDGFPLNPELWSGEFVQYDYIGAPWHDGVVGNGGFCMESKRFMTLKRFLPAVMGATGTAGNSDVITCRTFRSRLEVEGIRFAPTDVALRFSVEQMNSPKPSFGFHGRRDRPKEYALGWRRIEESEKTNLRIK